MRVRAVLINSHIIIIILLFVGVEGRGKRGGEVVFLISITTVSNIYNFND